MSDNYGYVSSMYLYRGPITRIHTALNLQILPMFIFIMTF